MPTMTQEEYYVAAHDRLEDANALYGADRYTGALYLAGCAMEAMMWAFIPAEDVGERGRHNFFRLFQAGLDAKAKERFAITHRSGAALTASQENRAREQFLTVGANLTEASVLWHNSIRYHTASMVSVRVRKSQSFRTWAKGDLLKAA